MNTTITSKNFFICLFSACLAYFSYEAFATYFSAFYVDDFNFAHLIYRYKNALPYRDFAPYKTVLGYYLLLPPMLSSHSLLAPLYNTKIFIALLNSILFFISGCWLTCFFPRAAVLGGMLLIIFTEFVLSYSTNIRVDIFAYWLCLFAFLLLLENRHALAGILIGTGFLFSQKALWYIVASNCAIGVYWLCFSRNWRYASHILLFNFCCIATIMIYAAFWAHFSSFSLVMHNLFLDAAALYKLNIYDAARIGFWSTSVSQNPLLLLLWPVTLLSLFVTSEKDTDYQKRLMIVTYAFVIMLSLISYKQPFTYYVLTAMPAFMLLYAAFFSWLSMIPNSANATQIIFANQKILILLTLLYLAIFIFVSILLSIGKFYFCIGLIPVFLLCYLFSAKKDSIFIGLIYFVMIVSLILPLISYFAANTEKSARYQKSVLYLADRLLRSGGDDIDGVDYFYNRTQPVPAMRHLDLVAIAYLAHQSPLLLPVMTPFLDHYPAAPEQVIQELQTAKIKFYINNYRINGLPAYLKNWFAENYLHFWGSIYLYAPTVTSGTQKINLKFSGNYAVNSAAPIMLDGKFLRPAQQIRLREGAHFSHADVSYRLQLLDDKTHDLLDPRYQNDNWKKMLGS